MSIPNGAEYTHQSGRSCAFSGAFWSYRDDADGEKSIICNLSHPGSRGSTSVDHDPTPPVSYSDCDPTFGMPHAPGLAEDLSLMFPPLDKVVAWSSAPGLLLQLDTPSVPATPEAEYIVQNLLRQWLDTFLEKNAKYARVNSSARLGPRGHFPDINRKNGILLDRIWEGNDSPGETTSEVVGDMIGHLFLLWAELEMEEKEDEQED